ncbi:MAG: hypothetical protein ACRCZF_16205 [Gemmataceae bacterium]
MNRLTILGTLASAALALTQGTSHAGWDNVFQVTCNKCGDRSTSFYTPAPAPQSRTEYIQRSYYQPVTEYKREAFYTPIEEKVKSYYYEPVTSYKYTTYYDACSGCPQRMVEPVTSYVQREKCNTVTKWVERSRVVPVTSYRQVTTTQPVVTYYGPQTVTSSAYLPMAPVSVAPAPQVQELRSNPPVVIPESGNGSSGQLIPRTDLPTEPNSLPRTLPPSPKSTSSKVNTASNARKPTLRGEVVLNDRQTPRASAKLTFVNPQNMDVRVSARTNEFGEFEVSIPAGEWFVYLGNGDGKAVYHKKLTVTEFDNPLYRVVSR